MHPFFKQLRTRLILGSVILLLGLTVVVVLVVRDSLLFSARNMGEVGAQALLTVSRDSLLEIARREAELSDHAVHHNPPDLNGLHQRLQALNLSPNSYAFVMDEHGSLVAASSNQVAKMFAPELIAGDPAWQGYSLLEVENPALRETILQMQAGKTGTADIEVGARAVMIAYAPLEEIGWSLAIVEPLADISARAQPLSESIQNEANRILQATLLTIGYFSILVIIGAVLVARALTGPIQTLVKGTRTIGEGDLSVRIPVKTSDELGVLADSFNRMAESLQNRTQEFIEANRSAIENARLYEQAHTLAAVEERQRLARELHDSVTQSLYSLTLLAEASRRTASSGDVDKAIENIAYLGETAQQALKEMRLLVYELRPLALEQAGLVEALQHRLDAVEKRAGVDSQLIAELELGMPAEMETGLYRIALEALNNSLKHAAATSVGVHLRARSGQVELEISDNGSGFDPQGVQGSGGLGLVNIRERAEALRGKATILSKPGEGTRVLIVLPLQSKVAEQETG